MSEYTYCRLCEGSCGLIAQITDGAIQSLHGDKADPISAGFICDTAKNSVAALRHPERITQPHRRVNGTLVPVSWDEAIREIGSSIKSIRSQTGSNSVGLYAGDPVFRSSQDWVRTLSFGVGIGTSQIFTDLCLGAGPKMQVTEWMIGHPTVLMSDLARAHYVMLLGGNQPETSWGPMHAGMQWEAALKHSQKTKGAKVVVADPCRTRLAGEMNQHVPIRPGTEPFLLLGMLSAVVHGSWWDAQYIRDYTRNSEKLLDILGPWTPIRCAEICGLEPATLSGIALKFSRSAMGLIHPGHGTFANANAIQGAWAWLALHTLTANTLRPGGLFEHTGMVDVQPLLASIPSNSAPKTRVGGHSLMLMQAPSTLIADEILTPGEGQMRALICVAADPLTQLPGRSRVEQALKSLDLLVVMGRTLDDTTNHADWVLPITHPWEQSDLFLHHNMLLPVDGMLSTPALVKPNGEARPIQRILKDLFSSIKPGIRGSSWGTHLGLLAQHLGRTDLRAWEDRILDWVGDIDREGLETPPHRFIKGATDRSTWRPSTPDERIDLLPEAIIPYLKQLEPPVPSAAHPFYLRTSSPLPRRPDDHHGAPAQTPHARIHPDMGIEDGATVEVNTRYGRLRTTARCDDTLRPDVVDLPRKLDQNVLDLLNPARRDGITGTPELDGLICSISTV